MSPTEGAGSIIGAEKGAGVRILEAKIVKRCNKDSLITSNAAGKYPLGFPTRKLLEKPRGKASSGGWWEPSRAQGSSRSMTLEGLETGTEKTPITKMKTAFPRTPASQMHGLCK